MGSTILEAVFPFEPAPAEDVADICLANIEVGEAPLRLFRKRVTRRTMTRVIRSRQVFLLDWGHAKFDWAGIRNYDFSRLVAAGLRGAEDELLRALCGRMPLVSARLFDEEYEYWQNAEDPLQFESEGRTMEGLPMKSNGLPPPLMQLVVDTSGNPGRRVFRDGFVEGVASRMWLGPEFFKRVPGANRSTIRGTPGLDTRELEYDVLQLTAHDEPFVDERTSGIQDRLRRLLFYGQS